MTSKRFKLKFSLSSFQFCRNKKLSSAAKTPSPATYHFSPINPKAREIAYPYLPSPPPTTPNHPFFNSHLPSNSKVTPLTTTPRICNSPVSLHSEDHCRRHWLAGKSKTQKKDKDTKKKNWVSVNESNSNDDFSGWLSEEGDETGSLASITSRSCSFADDYSGNFPLNETAALCFKAKSSSGSVVRRMMAPGCVMAESVAVVKKSEKPYDDFKRSMLEMILEKKMFDAKELEELLQCFLSLNSRHHHADIVAAFTEIWEFLFT